MEGLGEGDGLLCLPALPLPPTTRETRSTLALTPLVPSRKTVRFLHISDHAGFINWSVHNHVSYFF